MTNCSAGVLRLLDANDGKTAMFGCIECGWEERVPVEMRGGVAHVTTAMWCRKNPPTISVGIVPIEEVDKQDG